MSERIQVAILEKNPGYRAALKAAVSTASDMACVGVYSYFRGALGALPARQPDVVLLGLPGETRSGASLVRQILGRVQSMSVVVLSSSRRMQTLFECLSAGAVGYLLRTEPWNTICDGIRQARQGGSPFSPPIAAQAVKLFRSLAEPPSPDGLSDREREISQLLAKPARNKEIALALNLSLPTVRTHLRTIYLKLRVQSRAAAIQKVRESNPLTRETRVDRVRNREPAQSELYLPDERSELSLPPISATVRRDELAAAIP
jgi:DNA-binding NarL/FixJ family response regulator